jgi:TPR repeat protein
MLKSEILKISLIVFVSFVGSFGTNSLDANAAVRTGKVRQAASTDKTGQMAELFIQLDEQTCLQAFVESKFDMAYDACLPLAKRGVSEAQLVTGLLYALGEGVKKDMKKAKIWLTKAKKSGSEEAVEALTEFNFSD